MKTKKFALTLTAAALLPTFAFAATDEVIASFERDLQRGVTVETRTAAKTDAEDAVLASFDRDMYREPAATQPAQIDSAADPLVDAFSAALYGTKEVVLVSVERNKKL